VQFRKIDREAADDGDVFSSVPAVDAISVFVEQRGSDICSKYGTGDAFMRLLLGKTKTMHKTCQKFGKDSAIALLYSLVLIAIKHHRMLVSPQIFLHLIETDIFEKISLDQLVANIISGENK
jgi:hypothetical protein